MLMRNEMEKFLKEGRRSQITETKCPSGGKYAFSLLLQ